LPIGDCQLPIEDRREYKLATGNRKLAMTGGV